MTIEINKAVALQLIDDITYADMFDQFNMGHWLSNEPNDTPNTNHTNIEVSCGFSACAAGWIMLRDKEYRVVTSKDDYELGDLVFIHTETGQKLSGDDIGKVAGEKLGWPIHRDAVGLMDSNHLFMRTMWTADNVVRALKRMVDGEDPSEVMWEIEDEG